MMTQLGLPLPTLLPEIQKTIRDGLAEHDFKVVDASSQVTGRDFLLKIWELMHAVPLGIAIVHEGMPVPTLANIFFELGHMQGYGKELLIVKTPAAIVPSDLVRTEYIEWDSRFREKFDTYLNGLQDRADYYVQNAELLEKNPLLSIDYLRRAFLITGEKSYRSRAKEIADEARGGDRAKNSVEALLVGF